MTKLLTSSHRILPTHGKSRVVMQRVLAVLFGLVMASCASSGPVFPEPLRAAKSEAAAAETLGAEQATQSRVRPRLEEGPTASAERGSSILAETAQQQARHADARCRQPDGVHQ